MTMFKKNGGFTLVELIVVIAILAILAGVAIPAYSGYITKAQDAAVVTELDAIQTAAQGANAVNNTKITKITVNATTIVVEGMGAGFDENFVIFYDKVEDKDTSAEGTLTFKAGQAIANWANSSYGKAGTAVWEQDANGNYAWTAKAAS